jgi:hypothetical protein
MAEGWSISITDSLHRFLTRVLDFLPNLLEMILILIVGFILAWLVEKISFRFLRAIHFDRASEESGLAHFFCRGGAGSCASRVLSRFFYWLIVVITIILGINALRIQATQALVTKFFNYLPHLFAAIVIAVVGYLVANFLGRAVLIAAVNARLESAKLYSRTVKWLIIVLALAMALYHLEIAERIVVVAFAIFFGGIVLSLALAFGWGGRDLAKNFLERLYRRREAQEKGPDEDRISHI